MLSGITSYLFGGTSAEVDQMSPVPGDELPNDPGFKTKNTEEEWVLVDRVGNGALTECDEMQKSSSSDTSQENREYNLRSRQGRLYRSNSDAESATSSGMSSPVHLLHPSMEESWLVTPPPCFTAGDLATKNTTTHPLENLLIEHPSMSVYAMRGRPHSAGADSDESESSLSEQHPSGQVTVRTARQTHARATTSGSVHASLQAKNHQRLLHSTQRITKRQQRGKLSPHNIERSNRVTLNNSRGNHNLRRKDKMMRPSGVSNNRKMH